MTNNLVESFHAKRAVELSGLGSVAMLDYLQRSEVFIPERKRLKRRGKRREYTFRDVLILKAIKRLLDSGASVANLKKSLLKFQKPNWKADPTVLEGKNGVIKYLVVSSDNIYLRENANTLVDLSNSGQLTFSFIIDLDNLHNELKKDLGFPVIEQPQLALEDTV